MARTLMVQGTASGVGKSWMVTALCRILRRRGCRVAPFKAQNMSNNAAVTRSGGEVGRAQALQAEAAGVEVDERMNPVLLKPIADDRSDVVVMGRSRPDLSAMPWLERRGALWPEVTSALDSLRRDFDWVVIEGAGSPAEVNLRRADIVNMAVAHYAQAPVLLVADIDRGGAFAALVGTWQLLPPEDRERIRGFVLNRFRGDPGLLGDAPEVVRTHTGVDVIGVVPWIRARLPEEDAATLERSSDVGGDRAARARAQSGTDAGPDGPWVAIVRLPRVANFDDVLPLEEDLAVARPAGGVRWVEEPSELRGARAVVLPGTRNVVADLAWLHETGLARAIRRLAEEGTAVLGLCGGYQMLGARVDDPESLEGGGTTVGLGLLPVETTLERSKDVRRVRAIWSLGGSGSRSGELGGYEIHHGVTRLAEEDASAFVRDAHDPARVLGYRRGRVWGTYVHGCLRDDAFRSAWLESMGVTSSDPRALGIVNPIDVVADAVDAALDLDEILGAS
ncbi:MAG: cobyric acid synthase [Gemmatimonadota bacterium]